MNQLLRFLQVKDISVNEIAKKLLIFMVFVTCVASLSCQKLDILSTHGKLLCSHGPGWKGSLSTVNKKWWFLGWPVLITFYENYSFTYLQLHVNNHSICCQNFPSNHPIFVQLLTYGDQNLKHHHSQLSKINPQTCAISISVKNCSL